MPVLASDLPGTAEVIDGLPGVRLLPPRDVGAWRDALVEALADPSVRQAARGGAEAVRARFRWPAERLRVVYAAALADVGR